VQFKPSCDVGDGQGIVSCLHYLTECRQQSFEFKLILGRDLVPGSGQLVDQLHHSFDVALVVRDGPEYHVLYLGQTVQIVDLRGEILLLLSIQSYDDLIPLNCFP
jgi:hypothetical protein